MSTLQNLAEECTACRQCPHGETRTQTVFAKGDPLSTLCFVGEAPGEEEDAQGLPFVGDSGRFLDRQIAAMREYAVSIGVEFPASPYVCNVLKCRPPGNKLLKDGSDIAACSEHLWAQLRALPNLRVIVALGQTAAQTLLGVSIQITALRVRQRRILVSHLACLLRQPNNKELSRAVWADLKRAVEALR